ncbi:MAG TPA: DsbA family protein [Solirubrobacteraceae bacterium]|jgi:2-hydroxychromene-2-carboxylate isomerase
MSLTPAAFYFDLASPLAYLAAERVLHELGVAAEWRGVLERALPGPDAFAALRCEDDHAAALERVERRAAELGLQPLRWPDPFPFDSALAMRVATYARSIGRTVPFAQAAFRQAFAGGHSLANPDFVLIAAAACEMHPTAVLKAAERPAVAEQLAATTAAAAVSGVGAVPAIVLGEHVFEGERALEQATAHLGDGALARGSR